MAEIPNRRDGLGGGLPVEQRQNFRVIGKASGGELRIQGLAVGDNFGIRIVELTSWK